jgi:hypothetical protein
MLSQISKESFWSLLEHLVSTKDSREIQSLVPQIEYLGTAADSGLSFEEWKETVGRAPRKDWFEKAWPLVDEWQATRTGGIEPDVDFQRETGRDDGDPINELEIRFEYAREIAPTGQSFSDWRASECAKRVAFQDKMETWDWLMRVGPLIEEESRTQDPEKLRELHARTEYESEHHDSGLSFGEWKAKTEERAHAELKEQEIAQLRRELDAKDDEIRTLGSRITRHEDDIDKSPEVLRAYRRAAFWQLFCSFVLLDLAILLLLCWPAYSSASESFWIALTLGAFANLWALEIALKTEQFLTL